MLRRFKMLKKVSVIASSIELCCCRVISMESILLISAKKAINRVCMVSSFYENAENELCNQALTVVSF